MNDKHEHLIPFKIDKTEHKLDPKSNPVIGQYLRDLPPAVSEDYDLWLRGRGSEDDRIINPGDTIEIREGDHFYTAKRVITPGAR